MKGGVILFRGTGTDARRYLESDRSRADEYYLEGGTALAEFAAVDARGEVLRELGLTADEYAQWVNWINPLTGESMGTPRLPGEGRRGSPRFAEMVINAPKSLSIAAALHPEVSAALDAAQRDAMAEIRSWLGQHSVTRVGPRGRQEVVPVEQLETVSVVHKTSRAGDPHRHIHFQIGTRVWAAGAWRGLDTAALFRQQGAIRAFGTAVIAAHPQLAAALDAHGLTLDPVTGEAAELQRFNAVMSKRGEQVARNLARFEADWRAAHQGQEPGPVAMSRLVGMAWDHERPHKRPARLGHEATWRDELVEAGYRPDPERVRARAPVAVVDLQVQRIASRAVDRCAASASTWTVHDVQEQVTRLLTVAGVRAAPAALRGFVELTTRLAVEGCLSVLPPDAVRPEHVAHLTSLHVVAVETRLRDLLTARAAASSGRVSERVLIGQDRGLDVDQAKAAAAIASTDPLVVVEGAAGSGKTTMLASAIRTAADEGRRVRVLAPTKKAADVARQELGVASDSVAKLVHEHGWRWNSDGVWTRLHSGDTDSLTGAIYRGPSDAARLVPGERIVVDEAGMLDQDTALALLIVADENGATLALVGDRAQLAAVGRGGVLDIAADLASHVYDVGTVHRFADHDYADLTLQLRRGDHPATLFDRLHRLGLISLHDSEQALHGAIAHDARDGEAITVATNDEAHELNARIREKRARTGQVDDTRTAAGSDGLPIGSGDVIQTRRNDPDLHVANRQTWTVQAVGDDGSAWATERGTGRKQRRTVHLPAEYVVEHTHLAYASTAYGVQGVTVSASHTVLSESLDAAGIYVGMTRGRDSNRLHLVAADLDDAREQFIAVLERDRADRGVTAATQAAHDAVTGLIADGPVTVINTERARLEKVIEEALHESNAWERAVAEFDHLRETYSSERTRRQEEAADADARAARVRAEIVAPLLKAATADGAAYLAARDEMWNTATAHSRAGLLTKRGAGRVAAKASEEYRATETAVFGRWGALPPESSRLEQWAEAVAANIADAQPAVIEANRTAAQEHRELNRLDRRYLSDFVVERRRLLGDASPIGALRRIAELREVAHQASRDLTTVETLPLADSVEFIRDRAARAAVEQEVADRARGVRASRDAAPQSLSDDTHLRRNDPGISL